MDSDEDSKPNVPKIKQTDEELAFRLQQQGDDVLTYLQCTRCKTDLSPYLLEGKSIPCHPLLEVLFCQNCLEFYGDGIYSTDEDGDDKYCRWCGEGGTLFLCSKMSCSCGFCKGCIKRHFGAKEAKEVEDNQDWLCYFCNPSPLYLLRWACFEARKLAQGIANGSAPLPSSSAGRTSHGSGARTPRPSSSGSFCKTVRPSSAAGSSKMARAGSVASDRSFSSKKSLGIKRRLSDSDSSNNMDSHSKGNKSPSSKCSSPSPEKNSSSPKKKSPSPVNIFSLPLFESQSPRQSTPLPDSAVIPEITKREIGDASSNKSPSLKGKSDADSNKSPSPKRKSDDVVAVKRRKKPAYSLNGSPKSSPIRPDEADQCDQIIKNNDSLISNNTNNSNNNNNNNDLKINGVENGNEIIKIAFQDLINLDQIFSMTSQICFNAIEKRIGILKNMKDFSTPGPLLMEFTKTEESVRILGENVNAILRAIPILRKKLTPTANGNNKSD